MTESTLVQQWHTRVEAAVIARDGSQLRTLFDEAVFLFGDRASAEWAQALSAYDASAQTG